MRRALTIPASVLSTALLAACGPGPSDPGPGGVTVSEAQALDEAAAMLDQRRPPPESGETGRPAPPTPSSTESAQ